MSFTHVCFQRFFNLRRALKLFLIATFQPVFCRHWMYVYFWDSPHCPVPKKKKKRTPHPKTKLQFWISYVYFNKVLFSVKQGESRPISCVNLLLSTQLPSESQLLGSSSLWVLEWEFQVRWMDGYLPAGGFLFERLPSVLRMKFDHNSKILSDN